MNDIHIVHTQRRIHSLPNTRTSSTSSPRSPNYDLQQIDCSFYSKLNNNLSHHHNRISRDASGRSSQISDISRFELPGTTRIRLAKLIGRISGREFVKTVKASLTLMPLLGIPEIIFITPYHPYLKPGFDIINAFLTSTQGIWVTLLYCFLTKEVRRQFTKRLKMRSLRTSLHPHRRSARMNKLSP
ncbi:Corticotropin-releasing factor receptor 1 [Schistosoma japonicum]|uniref:Corticotropin-releasing factor receptor 1 n=1 Tax=Schistosoma japonicum TaxID=6182 RepID=A0A4Z2D0S5_SCHJA|nr:Corticotropin-releasing factor receptor 1 [Schistosoma japonicum]TNN09978.1 Corticotropin-releasing factor receptor 1 [Schistosoma japonicum]